MIAPLDAAFDRLEALSVTGDPFEVAIDRIPGSSVSIVRFDGVVLAVVDSQSRGGSAVVTLRPGLDRDMIREASEHLRRNLKVKGAKAPIIEPVLYDGVFHDGERFSSIATFVATNNRQLLDEVRALGEGPGTSGELWPKMVIRREDGGGDDCGAEPPPIRSRRMYSYEIARMTVGGQRMRCGALDPSFFADNRDAFARIRALAMNFRREVYVGLGVPGMGAEEIEDEINRAELRDSDGAVPTATGEACFRVLSKDEQAPKGSILNRSVLRLAAVSFGRRVIRVDPEHHSSIEQFEGCHFAFSCDLHGPLAMPWAGPHDPRWEADAYRGPIVAREKLAPRPPWTLIASRVVRMRQWPRPYEPEPPREISLVMSYISWALDDSVRQRDYESRWWNAKRAARKWRRAVASR